MSSDKTGWHAQIRTAEASTGTEGAANSLAEDLFNTLADQEAAADAAYQDAVRRQNLDHTDPRQADFAAITALAQGPTAGR